MLLLNNEFTTCVRACVSTCHFGEGLSKPGLTSRLLGWMRMALNWSSSPPSQGLGSQVSSTNPGFVKLWGQRLTVSHMVAKHPCWSHPQPDLVVFFFLFETRSHTAAQAVTLGTITWQLSLLSAGVTGLSHHFQPEEMVDGYSNHALSCTSGSGLHALGRSDRILLRAWCCRWIIPHGEAEPQSGQALPSRPHEAASEELSHPRHWLPGLSEVASQC